MKILKICIIAFSIGVFTISCHNRQCADKNGTALTAPIAVTPVDGARAAINEPVDTTIKGTASIDNDNAALKESTASAKGHRIPGKVYIPAKKSTTAKSNEPDLEASKKREANFTHGTGAEYPGR